VPMAKSRSSWSQTSKRVAAAFATCTSCDGSTRPAAASTQTRQRLWPLPTTRCFAPGSPYTGLHRSRARCCGWKIKTQLRPRARSVRPTISWPRCRPRRVPCRGSSIVPGTRSPDPLADQKRYDRLLQSPSYLVRMAGPRLLALRDRFDPPEGSYLRELELNYFENPAAWNEFADQLRRFATLAGGQGACGHVFLHYQLARVNKLHPFTPIYDKVGSEAEKLGLTVSSAGTYLGAYDEDSLRISMWDQHPSPLGHRLYAQALQENEMDYPDPYVEPPPPEPAPPHPAEIALYDHEARISALEGAPPPTLDQFVKKYRGG